MKFLKGDYVRLRPDLKEYLVSKGDDTIAGSFWKSFSADRTYRIDDVLNLEYPYRIVDIEGKCLAVTYFGGDELVFAGKTLEEALNDSESDCIEAPDDSVDLIL